MDILCGPTKALNTITRTTLVASARLQNLVVKPIWLTILHNSMYLLFSDAFV